MNSSSSIVRDIPDKTTHDTLISSSATTPLVLYIFNSALPICKTFTPAFENLARKSSEGNGAQIQFAQMDHTPETSPMFKFAPTQLPVVVLIQEGRWARTLMSPTIKEVEAGVKELVERAWERR